MRNMKFLFRLVVLVSFLGLLHCTPEVQSKDVSEETLKQLSLDGGKLFDEEVKRALYGVKEMREVMEKNEQKHEHLMKSLRHSIEKKKGATQLNQEVTLKLEEAEEHCKESLQKEWEECRPCLEDACKTFYTTACRRGFATFHTKVENFFRRVSTRFGLHEQPLEVGDIAVNQDSMEEPDVEVRRIEDSFNRLLTKMGTLFNRSVTLAVRMHSQLDQVLQRAFSNSSRQNAQLKVADGLFSPDTDSTFLQGVGLEEVLDSFFDFGKSVVDEFGSVVTHAFDNLNEALEEEATKKGVERAVLPRFMRTNKVCRDLRRQTSQCWQLQNQCEACNGALLTECPSVRELHVELDQVSELLDVSREQYQEVLNIVQRHTDETVSWLGDMASEFSWVTGLASNSSIPESIFRIITVVPKSSDGLETRVDVNILNSSPFILSVPGELELQDPAFIEYVAQEALGMYKQLFRFDNN